MATRNNWSEEETTIAFFYYCQIPFGKIHQSNPEIKRIADMIGRSKAAVVRKMANLAHYDPGQRERNVVGLSHTSKLDRIIVERYIDDWDRLAVEAKTIEAAYLGKPIEELIDTSGEFPEGADILQIVATRLNQDFFRNAVLSSYRYACCITGMTDPELLIASHIKPWKESEWKTERTNPRNGLCLNALHDKAFDRGLLTVLPDFTVRVSSKLSGTDEGTMWIRQCDKQSIILLERFLPCKEFLEYHNDVIFQP